MAFIDTGAVEPIATFVAAREGLKEVITLGFEAYGYAALYGNQPAHLRAADEAMVLGMVLAHPNLTPEVLVSKIKEIGEVRRRHVDGDFSLP